MEIKIKIERKEETRKETRTLEEKIDNNNNNNDGGRRGEVSGGHRYLFYYGAVNWRRIVGANERMKQNESKRRKEESIGV